MNFDHPSVIIEQPAPGHFVIKGHAPRGVFVEDVGHVVPPEVCYVSPEVPSEALVAILEARGDHPPLLSLNTETGEVQKVSNKAVEAEAEEEDDDDSAPHVMHDAAPRRGRPRKHH